MRCVTPDKKRLKDGESLNKDVAQNPNTRQKARCCPYDYDPSLCKVIGDRFLCGYNRNIGGYPNENAAMELQNGCRIRNGRLECGYVVGPFTNPRRPLADTVFSHYDDAGTKTATERNDADKNNSGENHDDVKELLKYNTPENSFQATTRCLEIRERIVCRNL